MPIEEMSGITMNKLVISFLHSAFIANSTHSSYHRLINVPSKYSQVILINRLPGSLQDIVGWLELPLLLSDIKITA